MISRRHMLKMGAGAAALLATGFKLNGAEMAKKIPIGLQLYSVRKQCETDLPGVLAAVGKMGYKGVEYAGYYGRKAEELKKLMDDNGLVCCGTHTGWGTIQADQLKKTIEFNQGIGNKFLIVPGLPGDRVKTVDAIKETAKIFTDTAAQLKELGMHTGYHAHGGDFKKMENGLTEWENIFDNCGPDVVMQMDIGNCLGGGGDPYAMIKKYAGRSLTIHIKEHGGPAGAVIGEGTVKWAELFELCETVGKTQWYIVEHESDPKTPMESIEKCLTGLKKLGKA